MINKRLSGLVAAAFILLLASCSKKTSSYTRYIPKDANFVAGIDVRSILQKLDKDSLSIDNLMATFKDEGTTGEYTNAVEMYKEFKDAGIDFSNRVFVAVNTTGMMNGGAMNGSFATETVAGMKDTKKFEDFLKKQPNTKDIKKGDGFSYTGSPSHTIAWNDNAVVLLSSQNMSAYSPDGMSAAPNPNSMAGSLDALTKLFKQDEKESIAEAEGFGDLQSKTADINLYSQTGDLSKFFPMLSVNETLKNMLQGYSLTTVNFEKGKAVAVAEGHLKKELADLLEKYSGPEVDYGLIENYPSSNIDGITAFSFKPELIPGLLKEFSINDFVNSNLQPMGLTTDEAVKAFKGDFAVVVSDFAMGKNVTPGKDAMMMIPQTTAKVLFAARLGDKATVDKLIKLGVDRGLIMRNGNNIVPGPQMGGNGAFPFTVGIVNDLLVVSTDAGIYNAYLAKTQKIGLPSGVESTLKGKAISTYIDAQKIMAGVDSSAFDDDMASKAIFNRAKATLKSGWYTLDNLSGTNLTGKAEVNLMNDDQNSLSQIVKLALYAYQQQKAQEARERNSMPQEDSVRTAPMVPAEPQQK